MNFDFGSVVAIINTSPLSDAKRQEDVVAPSPATWRVSPDWATAVVSTDAAASAATWATASWIEASSASATSTMQMPDGSECTSIDASEAFACTSQSVEALMSGLICSRVASSSLVTSKRSGSAYEWPPTNIDTQSCENASTASLARGSGAASALVEHTATIQDKRADNDLMDSRWRSSRTSAMFSVCDSSGLPPNHGETACRLEEAA